MAEDEGVGSRGFSDREERAQAIQLLGSDWEANHLLDCSLQSGVKSKKLFGNQLTHDINGTDRASNTIWIVFYNVSRLENSLDGARFNIELVVAETVLSRSSSYQYGIIPAAGKCHAWDLGRYLSSGEKFQSVTAP